MTQNDSTVLVTRLYQVMTAFDSTQKFLDESHSTLPRMACDSDSTKMTRARLGLSGCRNGIFWVSWVLTSFYRYFRYFRWFAISLCL